MIRVLIVDDEPLARETLRLLLLRDRDMEIVGEVTGTEAVELLKSAKPDILFLDVQMPEVGGFDVLEQISPESLPVVVFVTAFDQYAVRAFEVHALDYLLKPFDDKRFEQTLRRAKDEVLNKGTGAAAGRVLEMLQERDRALRYAKRFLVRARDRVLVIKAHEVDWIQAADDYVSLQVGGKSHLLRETMNEIEKRLDPEQFFRVHRSAIVNIERVQEVHPLFRGDCEVLLSDGARVRLSRSRREEFERLFASPSDGS